MKYLLFSIIFIALTIPAFSQNSQQGDFPPSGDSENKSALRKMMYERNFPETGTNNFGRYTTELLNYRNASPQQLNANWSYVDASGNLYDDVGRTASITIDTINSGRLYVCTPHSGLWRSDNNGATYTPLTESLATQNTSCLVVDPSNTNNLYLATGTFQMDMPANSMGIYISNDAGVTWNLSGLAFSPSDTIYIGDLIINPQNSNSLLAATSDGLYRTYDSGISWTKIINDIITSVRFKPGDTTVIYAASTEFYRSNNSGSSFIPVTAGINNTFQWRYRFYVRTSSSFPNHVYYVTAGGWANPNFYAEMYVHKSVDNGLTFSVTDTLTGEACVQFDVSQQTEDKFVAGYRNTFKKEGTSSPFTSLTQWYAPQSPFYMHADQRYIAFDPRNDSTVYFCNDGGLYRQQNNINNSINITSDLQLAHLYNFANSSNTDYKILVASLDVYPYIIGNSGISQTFSQFVEAFATHMSPLNDDIYSMSMYYPGFTINDGNTFFSSNNPVIQWGFFNSDNFQYDACDTSTCYFSYFNDIMKSTDYGANFMYHARTTYNPQNNFIKNPEGFVVCRSNPRYIYVYYIDSVYVTKDGSNNFSNISSGLPVGTAAISHMVVDPTNENNAWISFSGYSSGNKVFHTTDAGQTWTNISAGLPNIPINVLTCQNGIPGALYAGTDGGVFYTDNNLSSWQLYSTNLPSTMVTDLEIQYNLGKIRAATFGRGVWESDLYQPVPSGFQLPPVALFRSETTHGCPGELINFANISCGVVDSVLWLFPNGTPLTSVSYSPSVSYASPGMYLVTLVAYNSGGSDTLTITDYIEIASPLPLPYYEPVSDLNAFVLPSGSWTTEVNGDDVNWNRGWWTDGVSGGGDDFLYYDNYYYNLNGIEERITFPTFDLTGTIEPKLFFYRSYQRRDLTSNDTLNIYIKPCGGNEIKAFSKGGPWLANIPGYYNANYWIPGQPSHWQLDSVDLTPYAGLKVVIAFGNQGYGGQILYIDDFRVIETNFTGVSEHHQQNGISVFPNPATNVVHIRSEKYFSTPVIITDPAGKVLMNIVPSGREFDLDISFLADGIYFLQANGTIKRVMKVAHNGK